MSSVENLEVPPAGGLGWTETDLKENVLELAADDIDGKMINDGVEAKRFKVRAWGGVHRFQSGQEIPGAQCEDKDDDIRRIGKEECCERLETHTKKQCQAKRGGRFGCNSRGGRSHRMFFLAKAAMKWKGDGEKRTEWKGWKCTWWRDGAGYGEHSWRNGKTGKEEAGQSLGIGWSIWGKEFGGGTI